MSEREGGRKERKERGGGREKGRESRGEEKSRLKGKKGEGEAWRGMKKERGGEGSRRTKINIVAAKKAKILGIRHPRKN